jgi:hypothetical protein
LIYKVRKEFGKAVTTHYGPVSQLHCIGKFSSVMVKERVEQWRATARAATDAIVDTAWDPSGTVHDE